MRRRAAAVALGRDDGFDVRVGQLVLDHVGVIAPVCQQGVDMIGDHAHQRAEALDVVRLPRRQDKGERASLGMASLRRI